MEGGKQDQEQDGRTVLDAAVVIVVVFFIWEEEGGTSKVIGWLTTAMG